MRRLPPMLMLTLLALNAISPAAAQWEIRATDDATLEITRQQAPVVTAGYNFWAANWQYAGARLKLGGPKAGGTGFSGTVSRLDLTIDGVITSPAANQLRYTWNITSAADLEGIIGGGLEFQLAADSPALGKQAGEPVLLEGNRGWKWPVGPGETILVEFDPPIANVYFERGNKNQIRAMLLGDTFPQGTGSQTMTITLPEGGKVAKSLAERYGPVDTSGWYADALPFDASPVDLSFLNHKPAGKHGFVRASQDAFVFEDGTPVRFWGGNLAAYAIFSDKEQILAQARRIARLGYNLMRIHHHDSTRWVGRTVIDKNQPDSQHFDAEVMDRLDWWIKCLRDEGVYVWLDLHVGRVFQPGDEIGEGFAEMLSKNNERAGGAEGKGYCYFNQRIETLMQQFNQEYLTHVNPYTRLAYKDDPAIMGLLVTNENDLTCHFGNLMLADKNNPWHNRRFEAEVKAFAARHGLPPADTGKTWEPGPAKLFLADWEYRWNRRMLEHLETLGVKVPVATTQMWGNMAMCGLPPLVAGGVIDVHSYGQAEALSSNPRHQSNYVAYIATGQAYGKPVAITEWNVPYPETDRFTAPLYVAGVSALQGWDAPMIYNYSQRAFSKPDRQDTWSTFSDPALTGMMPAAAILYRQGHVREAQNTCCLQMDREKLYFQPSHPKNMAALRTLVEQSKVTIGLPDTEELDWDRRTEVGPGVKVVTELDRDFIPAGQDFVRSDTGQLSRHWVQGYQTIDTQLTQAAHGWIGGETIQLERVAFKIDTPKAAVAVTSLDEQPIGRSKRMLITAIARAVPSENGRMPMLSEPVAGKLSIAAPAGLKLVPLAGDGERLEAVSTVYETDRYSIALPAPRGTHWFLLTESQ